MIPARSGDVIRLFLTKTSVPASSYPAVAAFSVGQQIAIAAWSALIGFIALATIFNVRSFKEVIRRGREARAASKAGTPAAET